jgi:hypothetical protein
VSGTGSGQERRIGDYVGATRVATIKTAEPDFSPAPDNTSVVHVIDRPNACYNTFNAEGSPCQDKPNFNKGVKTVKFCTRGMPIPTGESIRPYMSAWPSVSAPELDPKAGLASNAKVQIQLIDEPSSDYDQDPYALDRATPAGSTWLARFLARNPNLGGRKARLKTGYVTDPWDWNTFQSELWIVENIKGPNSRGQATMVLKDMLVLANRTKIPVPTDGKLLSDITDSAATLPLNTDAGAQYDKYGYPCWVSLGQETIKIASRTGDTLNVASAGHAQFGTVAAAHKANDNVQLCKTWERELLTDVLKDILNESGVSNTYIDTAQMTTEDADWLSEYRRITHCLSKPEDAEKLLIELTILANAYLWWKASEQKAKFKVNMPPPPGTTVSTLSETGHLRDIDPERLDSELLTYSAISYNLISATANPKEAKNFLRGDVYIDLDAEGPNELGERRADINYSRWLNDTYVPENALAVHAINARAVAARRDVPLKARFSIHHKDYDFGLGDLRDIDSKSIIDAAGNNKITRFRITKIVDKGKHIECEGRGTKFNKRYGWIAPNGTADYPTDQVYAHVANTSTGKMGNGDTPYLVM